MILSPSSKTLYLLFWLLLALGVVAVNASLVAALLRPVWVGIISVILSGPAILLGWQVSAVSAILDLVYIIAASLYIVGVARELKERIGVNLAISADDFSYGEFFNRGGGVRAGELFGTGLAPLLDELNECLTS